MTPAPHLINLERLKDLNIGQSLVDTTEAERTYRMLFLVSIDLLEEQRLNDGTHIYKVTDKRVVEYLENSRRNGCSCQRALYSQPRMGASKRATPIGLLRWSTP
jgi:hypothetical protein